MDEAKAPCLVSHWTSKWSIKLNPCFRDTSQPGVLLVCVALALRGTTREDGQMVAWTDGSLDRPSPHPRPCAQYLCCCTHTCSSLDQVYFLIFIAFVIFQSQR